MDPDSGWWERDTETCYCMEFDTEGFRLRDGVTEIKIMIARVPDYAVADAKFIVDYCTGDQVRCSLMNDARSGEYNFPLDLVISVRGLRHFVRRLVRRWRAKVARRKVMTARDVGRYLPTADTMQLRRCASWTSPSAQFLFSCIYDAMFRNLKEPIYICFVLLGFVCLCHCALCLCAVGLFSVILVAAAADLVVVAVVLFVVPCLLLLGVKSLVGRTATTPGRSGRCAKSSCRQRLR